MHDFLPHFRRSVFFRTAGTASACVVAAWGLDLSHPYISAIAFFLGACMDGAVVSIQRIRQVRSYRTFKAYALHEAWASSPRFHLTMSPESFVAIFEACLRSETWRGQMATMLQTSTSECRQDLAADPASVRCYWKLRYSPEWSSDQRLGALIACIGAFPRSCVWAGYESGDILYIETSLMEAPARLTRLYELPIGAQEFLFVTRRDLSWLLDRHLTFETPRITFGLNANVDLQVPSILPLADGSYLHVGLALGGGLEAVSVNGTQVGTPLVYADATALWSVWRHAVVSERHAGQLIVRVPSSAKEIARGL